MLYAILCYHDEELVSSWSKEEDAAVMGRLAAVRDRLVKSGKLGPVARLVSTTEGKVLRKGKAGPTVTDGPFAETKELVAGFMLLRVKSLEEAIEWVKRSPNGDADESEIEIRQVFEPEDFAPTVSDEDIQLEKRIRAQLADQAAKK